MIQPRTRPVIAAAALLRITPLASSCSSANSGGADSGASGGTKADLSAASNGVTSYLRTPTRILQTVPLPAIPPKGKMQAEHQQHHRMGPADRRPPAVREALEGPGQRLRAPAVSRRGVATG